LLLQIVTGGVTHLNIKYASPRKSLHLASAFFCF